MTTRAQKIAATMRQKHPYVREFDGKKYYLHDEFRSEDRAKGCANGVRSAGYLARVESRLVDDVMKGRSWTVYDVFIARSKRGRK